MSGYSTEGLTLAQRRTLASLPEDEREEYTRLCRANNARAERSPRQVAQELAEFDRAIIDSPDDYVPRVLGQTDADSELPTDPTGIDCWEAHESAGDQA